MAFDCKRYIGMCRLLRGKSQNDMAAGYGCSASNWQNKLTRNDFRVSELEKVAEILDANVAIHFVDKKDGKPLF